MKTRIAFIGVVSKEWMGGFNYFKNLLFALHTFKAQEIELYVFVGTKTENAVKEMFAQYATVIEHAMFDTKSFASYLQKIEKKIFKSNYFLERLLKKHRISILSHASIVYLNSCKTINWIPDFQYLHLPQMFSDQEVQARNESYLHLIKHSDKIILSSYDAYNDYKSVAPEYLHKAAVLQFVSQPDKTYFDIQENEKNDILRKYQLPEDFYYLPNQFWKHKNHMLVFESIKMLRDEKTEICLACSGHLHDHRHEKYIDELKEFIYTHRLENNIRLLGLIDYEDVFKLIKFSKAVINPSLFEGWSSTVEECKSVQKNMILSDLKVHQEQYPEATFFNRNDALALKNTLCSYTLEGTHIPENSLETRTKSFAETYAAIVQEVLNDR